jgi:hypothetical protein
VHTDPKSGDQKNVDSVDRGHHQPCTYQNSGDQKAHLDHHVCTDSKSGDQKTHVDGDPQSRTYHKPNAEQTYYSSVDWNNNSSNLAKRKNSLVRVPSYEDLITVFDNDSSIDEFPIQQQVQEIAQNDLANFEVMTNVEKMAFMENVKYIKRVLYNTDFPSSLPIVAFHGITMQKQSFYPLCAVTALNNAIGFPPNMNPLISPEMMARVADELWLKQAIDQGLGFREIVEPLRSASGDFSLLCIEEMARRKGYSLSRIVFNEKDVRDQKVLAKIKGSFPDLQTRKCCLVRPEGRSHYFTLFFEKEDYYMLDSLADFPQVLTKEEFIKLAITGNKGALMAVGEAPLDIDYMDVPQPGTVNYEGSIYDLWTDQELSSDSGLVVLKSDQRNLEIKVSDLMSLKPSTEINNTILDFALDQLQNSICSIYTMPTDFLPILEKGQFNPAFCRNIRAANYDKILVPVHDPGHWWLIILDLKNQSYLEYDSNMRKRHSNFHQTLLSKWTKEVGLPDVFSLRPMLPSERTEIVAQGQTLDCGLHVILRVMTKALDIDVKDDAWRELISSMRATLGTYILSMSRNGKISV